MLCCLSVLSPQTVVELFYQTAARKIIISQIYCQQQSPSLLHWSHMMSSVVHLLAQLLYPSGVCGNRLQVLKQDCWWC